MSEPVRAAPPMTEWKHIPFLPKRFEASTDGEMRVLETFTEYTSGTGKKITRRVSERVLKQRIRRKHTAEPQPMVTVYLGGGRANQSKLEVRVAHAVAAAFHGVPYRRNDRSGAAKWRIKFRDGDILNVRPGNLEWVHAFGELGPGATARTEYDEHLDGWRASDPMSVMSRLFEDAA